MLAAPVTVEMRIKGSVNVTDSSLPQPARASKAVNKRIIFLIADELRGLLIDGGIAFHIGVGIKFRLGNGQHESVVGIIEPLQCRGGMLLAHEILFPTGEIGRAHV